mmetsp:Transcript_34164/g.43884  ORF Transcript_34164/g.43884 Transcript_34164/m.43884 type:complete len:270 (-) Transcript_34164:642-1451(-)
MPGLKIIKELGSQLVIELAFKGLILPPEHGDPFHCQNNAPLISFPQGNDFPPIFCRGCIWPSVQKVDIAPPDLIGIQVVPIMLYCKLISGLHFGFCCMLIFRQVCWGENSLLAFVEVEDPEVQVAAGKQGGGQEVIHCTQVIVIQLPLTQCTPDPPSFWKLRQELVAGLLVADASPLLARFLQSCCPSVRVPYVGSNPFPCFQVSCRGSGHCQGNVLVLLILVLIGLIPHEEGGKFVGRSGLLLAAVPSVCNFGEVLIVLALLISFMAL